MSPKKKPPCRHRWTWDKGSDTTVGCDRCGTFGLPPYIALRLIQDQHNAHLDRRIIEASKNKEALEKAVAQVLALGFSTGHADSFEDLVAECIDNLKTQSDQAMQRGLVLLDHIEVLVRHMSADCKASVAEEYAERGLEKPSWLQ